MSVDRGHEAVILVVDDNVEFLKGIIQWLEGDNFIRRLKSKATPDIKKPVILKKGNVEVVFTPSFDEAKSRLSNPDITAAFLDANLGDPRPECTGYNLLQIALTLDVQPSIYSISDSEYFYKNVMLPIIGQSSGREIATIWKSMPNVLEKITAIAKHYNSNINDPVQKAASEEAAPK